ncbi:DUF3955 domain-containing protein [Oceanisphaera sp. KMM 10153]|uniref:DUF3955 domain-containing protein n=1 Tax=Oceanisphaera submarina TaxID=3390193 RepID=UPI003974E223
MSGVSISKFEVSMKFLSKYKISFLFCMSGVVCLMAYAVIGSYIDENGLLVEPFGFIPLFWLLELLALVVFIITFVKHRKTG